jgi:hypothetical protein
MAALLLFPKLHVVAATLYVSLASTHPVPPYASWSTAATNIQDAVDASTNGDLVLVTNGIYQGGIVVTNAIGIQSVNGLGVTLIDGEQTSRCATLADGASLMGFTLTNGTAGTGGGVSCASTNVLLSNCLLINNTATYDGGGIFSGTLTNCTLASNSAPDHGAGADGSMLNNCRITNNSGSFAVASSFLNNCLVINNGGEGVAFSALNNCTIIGNGGVGADLCRFLNNCIIYYNSRSSGGRGWGDVYQTGMANCCVGSSFAAFGTNSITTPPAFVDLAHGNYQLQIFSPCINAGNNVYAPAGSDLAGNPRIEGGTVDIGAFESDYTNLSGFQFVNLSSTNPVPPYTNWLTAATNIQYAIAAAQPGGTVIVAAGNYAYGSYVVHGQEPNRVTITNAITVLGLSDLYWGTNMAGVAIVGAPGIRGVYVGSNAVLSGFEITNGYANNGSDPIYDQSGGGVWCETSGVVSNCLITADMANNSGGGVYGGTVCGSVIVKDTASQGGGVSAGILNDCFIFENQASKGGGAYSNVLNNCTLQNNSATYGGGAADSALINCSVISNFIVTTGYGGGAYSCASTNCVLMGNGNANNGYSCYGGGAFSSILSDCTLVANSLSPGSGGGDFGGVLDNCALIGNSASSGGAAAAGPALNQGTVPIVLNNCLISSNSAREGGGVYVPVSGYLSYTNCILNNCTLVSNTATTYGHGGGAYWAELNGCTISKNAASWGGGVEGGLLSRNDSA